MLLMVIEVFRGGDPRPIGERFARCGRMMPNGVSYVSSWIDPAKARCFQIMEAPDPEALQPWIDAWSDLVAFEVIPVQTSPEYWERLRQNAAPSQDRAG
jgi:hypothetical protein